jgi:transcriptional regulator with XRE-family HTH domain
MSTKNIRARAFLDKKLGYVSFGELIKSHRLGDELTQVEMAQNLGISKQELCNIEKGRKIVSPERAKGFALLLGLSPEIFVKYVMQDQLKRLGLNTEIEFKKAA